MSKSQVYIVDYDMKQAEVVIMSKGDSLNILFRARIPLMNSVVIVAVTKAPKLNEITT